jgi:hypothetical protein
VEKIGEVDNLEVLGNGLGAFKGRRLLRAAARA